VLAAMHRLPFVADVQSEACKILRVLMHALYAVCSSTSTPQPDDIPAWKHNHHSGNNSAARSAWDDELRLNDADGGLGVVWGHNTREMSALGEGEQKQTQIGKKRKKEDDVALVATEIRADELLALQVLCAVSAARARHVTRQQVEHEAFKAAVVACKVVRAACQRTKIATWEARLCLHSLSHCARERTCRHAGIAHHDRRARIHTPCA
jgi:hypothetical protein